MPRRSAGNLLALGLSRVVITGSGVVIQVAAARLLGPERFGIYSFVLSIVALFAFAASLGIPNLVVREIARAPESATERIGVALPVFAALAAATISGVAAYAVFMDGRSVVVAGALVGALTLCVQQGAELLQAAFHGLRRMRLEVPGVFLGRLAAMGLTFGFLYGGLGVMGVLLAQALGSLVTLLLQVRTFTWEVGPLRPTRDRQQMGTLLREGFPFGMNVLFGAIYLQSDVLLLAEFRGDGDLGLYRAAAVFVLHLPVMAQILNRGLYPRMSRFRDDPAAAGRELTFAARVLLVASLPLAVGGMCLAEPLIVFVAGREYAAAALPLLYMLPMLPMRFVNNAFAMALSALDRQGMRTRAVVFAALFNLAANLVVIPRFGAVGAAATTLLTEIVLTLLFYAWLRPAVRELRLLQALVRSALPAAAMAALILALPPMHVLLAIAIGGAVYLVLSRLSGAWRPGDLRELRSI